jgi:hypothetical protein
MVMRDFYDWVVFGGILDMLLSHMGGRILGYLTKILLNIY